MNTVTRRGWLTAALVGAAAALIGRRELWGGPASRPGVPKLTVYKDPSCGCCTKWVEYLGAHGFATEVHDRSDMDEVKTMLHVPKGVASCHTAVGGTYVIEGHVPAEDIVRLYTTHPSVLGIAVPGMVTGSPGMEGGTPQAYVVVSFQLDGTTRSFAKH
jgi:hypothetical protein